jgi:hypothetical protein
MPLDILLPYYLSTRLQVCFYIFILNGTIENFDAARRMTDAKTSNWIPPILHKQLSRFLAPKAQFDLPFDMLPDNNNNTHIIWSWNATASDIAAVALWQMTITNDMRGGRTPMHSFISALIVFGFVALGLYHQHLDSPYKRYFVPSQP